MHSFLSFTLEESYINFGDYNLEQKFHHYNQLLFANKVPPCPVTWSTDLKRQAGITKFTRRGREFVPGTMQIEISSRYKRTEEMLNSTLIHEMIHAFWISNGHPEENHGFRFQAMAQRCTEATGIPVAITDTATDLELTIEKNVETTVLLCRRKEQWFAIFYTGTAFDDHKTQDQMKAYWGRSGVLPEGFSNDISVIRVQSSLSAKYKASRTVAQTKWYGISEREAQEILQHGKTLFKIVSGSVSREEAAGQLPSKPTLVVMHTNTRTGECGASFYMPQLGRDFNSLNAIKDRAQSYRRAGYNVEIFNSNSTIFSRGYKMLRNPNNASGYRLKPDTVAELRRTAQYLERWMQ
jgi:SprT-like family